MQHQEDTSFGIIPLVKENEVWKVFLIHQHGLAKDIYWTFPKGHPEKDETQEEAALRELYEETGLVPAFLHTDMVYLQTYSFLFEGIMIDKKVEYYLGIITDTEFTIQEEEVKNAGWFTFDEALVLLSHTCAKTMLLQVKDDISLLV
jgi:8-oxo-dGTP pyrophosphatase MutT (NUDIX family)